MTMSPSSVLTRTRTAFDWVDTSAVAVTTALSIRATTTFTVSLVFRSLEAIGHCELELTARQHVRSARVLPEPRVAHQVDIAAREQVLVVEHVEHVGTDLDVILVRHLELFRHRE